MKTVLCFGDSLTWGFTPASHKDARLCPLDFIPAPASLWSARLCPHFWLIPRHRTKTLASVPIFTRGLFYFILAPASRWNARLCPH